MSTEVYKAIKELLPRQPFNCLAIDGGEQGGFRLLLGGQVMRLLGRHEPILPDYPVFHGMEFFGNYNCKRSYAKKTG